MSCIQPHQTSYQNTKKDDKSELSLPDETAVALPQPMNCVLRLQSEALNHQPKNIFQTSELRNVEEIILSRTEIQELPKNFISNLENVKTLNFERKKLSKVPENISNLLRLENFNVSHNNLTCLPDDISTNVGLQSLNAASNKIPEFPKCVCQLKNLRHLNLSNNSLSKVPDEISNLVNLETLNLSNNTIVVLPAPLGELKQLCYLNLSVNSLSELPKEFTFFKLKALNLSYNFLVNIPDCVVVSLQNMSSLDLSHNKIAFFDSAPKCVSKLVSLDLSYNAFNDVPQWLFGSKCKSLTELNISNNKNMIGPSKLSAYSKRGEKVGVASSLRCLNASNCCFTSNSLEFLHGLDALEKLTLGNETTFNPRVTSFGNILNNFPTSTLSTCKNLKHLNLNGVTLGDLPENIGGFSEKVQTLDISNNDLHWLPLTFCYLTTLTKLQISNNVLALLPLEFGLLTSLEELRLDGNKLHSLPDSFANLSKLTLLDLYDNLFDEVPEVIIGLQNLKALDLEWNCFSVTNFTVQPNEDFAARYKTLKDNMRLRVTQSHVYTRTDCMKPDLEEEEEDSQSDLEEEEMTNGLDSSFSDEFPEDSARKDWPSEMTASRPDEEENWDVSDDPDSHFDPNYVTKLATPPMRKPTVFLYDINEADNFCPADIHSLPIRRGRNLPQPAHLRYVDGQFEDDDDNT